MSALLAPQTRPETPAPRLRAVPSAPRNRTKAPFVGLVAVLLGAGMAGMTLLNTILENRSRELLGLQREQTSLANQEAQLASDVNQLRSPRVLALKASDLGMVPAGRIGYIQLPEGQILGSPTPATGTEMPSLSGGLR